MESRGAKLFGHRIHPMLIPFPLGLLSTSVLFDVVYLLTGNGKWSEIAFWMIAAGVLGGLAAIVFGAIDFSRVPGEPGIIPIILSLLGASLAVVTGWFGGELVERLGVGVADGAHLNAPNSLSKHPATEGSTDEQRRG